MRHLSTIVLGFLWATPAHAEDFQSPNTLIWASVGSPWLLSARGEAWFGDEVTVELGVGGLGPDATLGFDWALRWRPDPLCFGCGGRDLLTIGLGPGGLVIPPIDRDGVGLAVGGDLGLAFVHWLSRDAGLTIAAHGGGGAAWTDVDFSVVEPTWWGFIGAGVAF